MLPPMATIRRYLIGGILTVSRIRSRSHRLILRMGMTHRTILRYLLFIVFHDLIIDDGSFLLLEPQELVIDPCCFQFRSKIKEWKYTNYRVN